MGVLLAGGQADVAPWWAVQISGLVIAFIPVLIFLLKRKDRKEIAELKKVVEYLKESIKKDG